ncbi:MULTISPECIES: chemotaxis protein CheA [unclassified Pseudomonas]|uniref:chemotaxis protein CheA n=1 Tax=Pseudomonas sp. MH10 TaxID=3048627 RepID=UPI002AC9B66F|nr:MULTISPECIES: chemotaxis protein CheA [unclassified Pseudomonas]MEB0040799.1 chemotaxis protein CheA [Pseudomonas sp. MH10]MEB0122968.1 chemotaxis protein CheA [Pseudomonas sp. CCI1.2]WPX65054.1 chemotaxis protein CheA [Pseudomonas sp. MH10]
MTINLDQAQQTFIVEARELLQDMETSLLRLENQPDDSDTLGAIFRAAHTIKGSAGLFGLMPIVGFTHIVEDVLDRLRDGAVAADAALIALLLKCADHMLELVEVVASQGGDLSAAAVDRETGLREGLQAYQDTPQKTASVCASAAEASTVQVVTDNTSVSSDLWHISLRFGSNVFRNGMDPLSFLRYLNTLGEIVYITTLADAMPRLDELDAESCYLGFEIDFRSDATRTAIAEAFDFVRDDCVIHILAPHSRIEEYLQLIDTLPEGPARLGEILTRCGALTLHELESGLATQLQIANAPGENNVPLGEILIEQRTVEPVVVQSALIKQSSLQESKVKEGNFVRVNADKLDELINLVGELVIASAGTSLLARSSHNGPLQESTSVVSGLVEEILDGALRLRMIPIGDTFNRFRRVVRDVSQELGKDIDLLISGADTELDKTVVEKIGDPLMHLLRNAMDHGIETPQARLAAGKPAKGQLHLNAYHDSGSIVLEIADDGAGLNRDRILQKAHERGLVPASATLTDQEIYNLIFEPGFSTAEAVTNLSGRGVGMDVVKRNITLLRGTVDLDSQPGQGTLIRIRLPLTLAIINGFLVGIGQASYVIPLDMVQECIELSEENRQQARDSSYLDLRGEVLPLVYLRDHFNHDGQPVRRENVVVVRCAEHKAGLVVDDLLGEFQTVIKPLGKLFSTLRGISGSTILGSGAVALILDVPALLAQIVQLETRHTSTTPHLNARTRQAGIRTAHGGITQ